MKKNFVLASTLVLAAATSLGAQANTCPPGTSTTVGTVVIPDRSRASQDACQMAVDVFQFMAPQLGLAMVGGNATLGAGSTLGGLGHFSIGARLNAFNGDLPEINKFPTPSSSGRTQQKLPSKSQLIGLPTADAAIGIFGGLPLALTNVGGVDLLLSAAIVPTLGDSTSDVMVKPEQNIKVGYGVRVGLLSESILVPGVSFTYLKRDLPTTTIFGKSTNLDVNITDAKVQTTAWRVTASKSFLLFGAVVGIGQDKYSEGANIKATTRGTAAGTQTSDVIQLSQNLTRTNAFADLSLNLPIFKIVGEIGHSAGSGGAISTYNSFSGGAADKARTYASLGLRLAL